MSTVVSTGVIMRPLCALRCAKADGTVMLVYVLVCVFVLTREATAQLLRPSPNTCDPLTGGVCGSVTLRPARDHCCARLRNVVASKLELFVHCVNSCSN